MKHIQKARTLAQSQIDQAEAACREDVRNWRGYYDMIDEMLESGDLATAAKNPVIAATVTTLARLSLTQLFLTLLEDDSD